MAAAPLHDARAVTAALEALADLGRAEQVARYFGVRPGGDGEGDEFLGIRVPAQRRVARQARDLPLEDVATLLASPVHEHRFVALAVLVARARSADPDERRALSRFYLDHRAGVNHWDLVDVSAPDLLGDADLAVLDALAASPRVWDRRMAVLATFARIRRGDVRATLELAERLLSDPHHMVHKGVGWMLREAGKRDPATLDAWLDAHAATMPRTMLRYAIERLEPRRRAALLAAATEKPAR